MQTFGVLAEIPFQNVIQAAEELVLNGKTLNGISCGRNWEGARPRPAAAGLFAEPRTDRIERLHMPTTQTCSRRARTRALPGLRSAGFDDEDDDVDENEAPGKRKAPPVPT